MDGDEELPNPERLLQEQEPRLFEEPPRLRANHVPGHEEHPPRQVGTGASQLPVERGPVHVGHPDVAHDERVLASAHEVESLAAVGGAVHLMAVQREKLGQEVTHHAVVLHEQDPHTRPGRNRRGGRLGLPVGRVAGDR